MAAAVLRFGRLVVLRRSKGEEDSDSEEDPEEAVAVDGEEAVAGIAEVEAADLLPPLAGFSALLLGAEEAPFAFRPLLELDEDVLAAGCLVDELRRVERPEMKKKNFF